MKKKYGKPHFGVSEFYFSEHIVASNSSCIYVWQNEGTTGCEGEEVLVSYLQD